MWHGPMVHHCRMVNISRNLGHLCCVYRRILTFLDHPYLFFGKKKCIGLVNLNQRRVNKTWNKHTTALHATIWMSVTFASSTNSNIRNRIKIGTQHLRIAKYFVTECIQSIQHDFNICCSYPVLQMVKYYAYFNCDWIAA